METQHQMHESMVISFGYRQVGVTVHGGGLDHEVMRASVHQQKGWLWFDFGDHTRYYTNDQEKKQQSNVKEGK